MLEEIVKWLKFAFSKDSLINKFKNSLQVLLSIALFFIKANLDIKVSLKLVNDFSEIHKVFKTNLDFDKFIKLWINDINENKNYNKKLVSLYGISSKNLTALLLYNLVLEE